jgi:hypothetical protein
MAFTARLPERLLIDAQAHAADLGISLNALLAVALNEYLANGPRRTRPSAPRLPVARSSSYPDLAGAVTRGDAPPPSPTGATSSIRPPKSRADPCPCGSVDRDGHRLKFKHCHGKT